MKNLLRFDCKEIDLIVGTLLHIQAIVAANMKSSIIRSRLTEQISCFLFSISPNILDVFSHSDRCRYFAYQELKRNNIGTKNTKLEGISKCLESIPAKDISTIFHYAMAETLSRKGDDTAMKVIWEEEHSEIMEDGTPSALFKVRLESGFNERCRLSALSLSSLNLDSAFLPFSSQCQQTRETVLYDASTCRFE